ncbi:MAG TPA: hypothetical protein PLR56_01095 [Brevefilum sp.]|nr:hypothetical protein [Brevefilum sp.]HPL68767.1 hypothetical protein [Brevefilum sp.]
MIYLIISFGLSLVVVGVALYLIFTKRPKKMENEILRLSETWMSAVLGGMLIAMGLFILVLKVIDPSTGGSDQTSYLLAAAFILVCNVSGSAILLFSLLKTIIACEDKLVIVSAFGKQTHLQWREIKEIKLKPLSNKATFISDKLEFVVGGDPGIYKKFIPVARRKIPPRVTQDLLDKLSNRFL